MSSYVSDVAEIGRLLNGNKATALVLYCNGPFCGKSKRLADELLAAGYTNVRRYQLGIPVWRALGGVTEIEPAGLRHVVDNDETVVLIDTREADDFRSGTLAARSKHPA
jgi:rhodanese-related sulfurtransferase